MYRLIEINVVSKTDCVKRIVRPMLNEFYLVMAEKFNFFYMAD